MALANDENFRKQFRTANFHGSLLTAKQGLMSEAEAIQMEHDDVDTILHRAATSEQCDLSYCSLAAVPPQLLELHHLRKLNLDANDLGHLPDEFGGLCYLEELCLRRNRLRHLPSTMCMMDVLQVLDASNNLLEEVPHEFADMGELRRLVLDFNYLGEFPPAVLHGMLKLEQLYIIENSGIVSFPESPAEWGRQHASISAGKTFYVEVDNSPELVSSIDRLRAASTAEFNQCFHVKYNKIWPDMVVDHLALGSLRTVQNMAALTQLGVTHVLTCGRNLRTPRFPESIRQLVLDVDDNDEQDMNQYFLRAIEFIDDCVAQRGLCIVHCFAGVSRSATVVVAYLMKNRHLTFAQALEYVQQQRPAANPNPNFRRQLIDFEVPCGVR